MDALLTATCPDCGAVDYCATESRHTHSCPRCGNLFLVNRNP